MLKDGLVNNAHQSFIAWLETMAESFKFASICNITQLIPLMMNQIGESDILVTVGSYGPSFTLYETVGADSSKSLVLFITALLNGGWTQDLQWKVRNRIKS